MPIRPENLHRYPRDWPQISLAIKQRAGWRCECGGECGRPAGHLDTDKRCRNHHNQPAYDATHHAQTRQRTRTALIEALMEPLFDLG